MQRRWSWNERIWFAVFSPISGGEAEHAASDAVSGRRCAHRPVVGEITCSGEIQRSHTAAGDERLQLSEKKERTAGRAGGERLQLSEKERTAERAGGERLQLSEKKKRTAGRAGGERLQLSEKKKRMAGRAWNERMSLLVSGERLQSSEKKLPARRSWNVGEEEADGRQSLERTDVYGHQRPTSTFVGEEEGREGREEELSAYFRNACLREGREGRSSSARERRR